MTPGDIITCVGEYSVENLDQSKLATFFSTHIERPLDLRFRNPERFLELMKSRDLRRSISTRLNPDIFVELTTTQSIPPRDSNLAVDIGDIVEIDVELKDASGIFQSLNIPETLPVASAADAATSKLMI